VDRPPNTAIPTKVAAAAAGIAAAGDMTTPAAADCCFHADSGSPPAEADVDSGGSTACNSPAASTGVAANVTPLAPRSPYSG
jgi:hypothetical protein